MKRLLTSFACIGLISGQAMATPVYHPPGTNLTFGSVSNGRTIMSDIANPAASAASMTKNDDTLRFGIFSSVGAGFEYGEADELFDELDAAANDLSNSFANVTDPSDATLINARINDINNILSKIEEDGYGKAFLSLHAPLMPIVVSSDLLGGSMVFDFNFSGVVRVGAIADPIQGFDPVAAQAIIDGTAPGGPIGNVGDVTINATDPFNIIYTLSNDSSVLLRAAGIAEAAIGYSRPVFTSGNSTLYAGVRGKYYQVTLYRDFEKVDTTQDSQDLFSNFDSDSGETTNDFGVDVGLLWTSDHMRLGATLTNINEPEFDYNNIDPVKYAAAGITDPRVVAELTTDLTYKMEKQLTLEGALHSQNQNWLLSASYDANEVKGPTGDEYQWMTASVAYLNDGWILPGVRAGYRVNQAGSELSYLTGGLTLFNVVNMDLAYGLDKVEIDGESLPRSFMFNLGLELTF